MRFLEKFISANLPLINEQAAELEKRQPEWAKKSWPAKGYSNFEDDFIDLAITHNLSPLASMVVEQLLALRAVAQAHDPALNTAHKTFVKQSIAELRSLNSRVFNVDYPMLRAAIVDLFDQSIGWNRLSAYNYRAEFQRQR